MQNARQLGFMDIDPTCAFMSPLPKVEKKVYVGLGYKKDAVGFWKVKHWGNENYAKLIELMLKKLPSDWKVVTTGDVGDLRSSIGPISRLINDRRFEFKFSSSLDEAFQTVASSYLYVGNDTGMMHVAASAGRDVLAMFFLENSIVKSRPLTVSESQTCQVIDGTKDRSLITPERIMLGVEVALSG